MFSLYINIDHLKLLDKSSTIDREELISSIDSCVNLWGGVKRDIDSVIYSFPSNYQYSKVNFLNGLKDIHHLLISNTGLVGYSIIGGYGPVSDEDVFQLSSYFNLKTTEQNRIWLTDDAYNVLNSLITGESLNGLTLLADSFYDLVLPNCEIDEKIIIDVFQKKLTSIDSSIIYIDGELCSSLYKNLTYWANKRGWDKSLIFDLRPGGDSILQFIKYLVTFNNCFNPLKDLDSYEKGKWGDYLTLYNNIKNECNDYFVLDDSNVHFNKLILLWFEAFTKRFKAKLIVNSSTVGDLDQLWEILSLINGLKIFVVGNGYNHKSSFLSFDELPSLNMCLGESLFTFLKKMNDKSLMILYITIITRGLILYKDILQVLSAIGFNTLELKEELDFFKRKGLLVGNSYLYSTSDRILYVIKELKGEKLDLWKGDFLRSLFSINLKSSFLYNYIYCIISLKTEYHNIALKSLFNFIEKELDLGKKIKLSRDILKYKDSDLSLKKIISYKDHREDRILNQDISDVGVENYNYDDEYQVSLIYIDILNRWSENRNEDLVKSCKDLFFIYQSKGDHFCETRVKILFSLALLAAGQSNEAVDYLELNTSYSLSINDTLSYIRSGCFLVVAQYVKGNFSGVLRVSEELLGHSWIKLKSKWYIYMMFVRFRALIDICNYDEAIDLIDKAIIIAKECNYLDALTVLNNWKGRGLYYKGDEGKAREVLLSNNPNNEGYYFLSEIEFYAKNYDRALTYIRKATIKYDETLLFDENIKWRDGFYLVEEFFNRDNRSSILNEEIESFYYMLLIYNGHERDGISGLKRTISNINSDSIGVYDYKYLYYLYSSTAGLEDKLDFNRDNLLNKVFKLLQKRTSNMEAHNQKHLYLNNFLNREIVEIARSKKLF